MNRDFEKKVKSKRNKYILSIVLSIVIIGVVISGFFLYSKTNRDEIKSGNFVTVEIQCKSLAKNIDALKDQALREYVPKNGIILPATKVSFNKGDTVFDVTHRVCMEKNIQIESKITNSVYVKGINYLYEFSAGKNSGWQYFVNGEKPNYGSDKIKVEKGDKIVWSYTVDYKKEEGISE